MPDRTDPLIGYQFALEVQGIISGYFTDISGIGSEQEVVEHKVTTPDGKDVIMKIPGRSKWGDITLKRGVTNALDCNAWRKMVEDGDIKGARKNGSIIAFDVKFTEIARWNFVNGWPSKYSFGNMSAGDSGVLTEELTIVHEGIVREK
ncbi:MAG: phage tail protein [Dehalococcoidia bacterium]|nr:phage tail protein [Dehalococcoidia bacterium]